LSFDYGVRKRAISHGIQKYDLKKIYFWMIENFGVSPIIIYSPNTVKREINDSILAL
jgi:hypothetical protein